MKKKNVFSLCLKTLMFQENKGLLINLNTTCVYAIIFKLPPQTSLQLDQPEVITATWGNPATCNIS